ncbi:FtsX-like permease family protein [Flammeovirgaceae bacterium SG7u.111]|nr:FtsX-like permease family protein [Flammeovirgaceae bacterium SG7u.132]WPO37167.1 FtsX-like permease family protein [Flammeovirgaceae bacterium SG7u.111]
MKPIENTSPPKWCSKLLHFFLNEQYLEEIEGDMEEVFQENLELYSAKKARRLYVFDSIKLLRPSLIKNFITIYQPNTYGMFKNNIKISLRVFRRNKAYAFINILGMSTGLAIALFIIMYAKFELSYEKYNQLSDRQLRLTVDILNGESLVEQDCETYPPLGPKMKAEMPEVEEFTRTYHMDHNALKVGDKTFREADMYAADPSFFTMFNYPLLHGNQREIFKKPYEMVLTKSMALKLFNKVDAVGESLEWVEVEEPFLVTGIVDDSPATTHLKFSALISYPTMIAAFGERENNWSGNNTFTYLQLEDGVSFDAFNESLMAFNKRLTEEKILESERFIAQPVRDIHLYSDKSFEPEPNGDATSVFFLLGVAFLVMVIAIVNYVNLSTSKSLDRAKEVGVRKVIGSSKSQLRQQFYTESLLVNIFSGIFAVLLLFAFRSYFLEVAGLPLDLNFIVDPAFWTVLAGFILVSSLLSGIFPAFVLSSFKPISVMKGKFGESGKGLLMRRALVVFQFSITIFLLIQTLTAEEQLTFMREKDLGLNIEQTVVLREPFGENDLEKAKTFREEILNYPQFQAMTISSCVPGLPSHEMSTSTGINLVEALEKKNFNFYLYWIDEHFIPTMEMELVAGKNFLTNSPNEDMVLVNEEAIKLWGLSNPEEAIGKEIIGGSKKTTIMGVLKNFHQASAKSEHIPMIFLYNDGFSHMSSIRIASGDMKENVMLINDVYESVFPGSPFDFFFLDQEYDKQYRADERFGAVFATLTAFAILIACLGLFGLVMFTVAKRTKEIGVRKVLGAEVWQIVLLLSKDFVVLVFISMFIAIPLTYFIVQSWLDRYAFRIDLEAWIFMVPALAVLLISVLTIVGKTLQISRANPINSLRDE